MRLTGADSALRNNLRVNAHTRASSCIFLWYSEPFCYNFVDVIFFNISSLLSLLNQENTVAMYVGYEISKIWDSM